MTDDSELSPDDDLSSVIADALAEAGGADEPADDIEDSPEPEGEEREAEASGDDADQAAEADPPSPAADQEAASGPDRDAEMTGAYRQVAEAFHGVISPYQAHIASKGVSPPQAVQALLAAEYQLSTGTPEQKAKILAQLAKDYGVEVDSLYDLEDSEPVNPEIAQIQHRQAALERHFQSQQAQVQAERAQVIAQVRQSVETEIAAFAEEKDPSGSPLRPHLAKVRDEMGRMIQRDPNLNIQEAYDNAVWADPTLRKQALAKRTAPTTAKANTSRPAAETSSAPTAAYNTGLRNDIRQVYRRAVEKAET
ncbi:MAG: hypothetical protein O7I42_22370 [Alphaproteobacteria bacterium]|nr:hypothetical protein [Alphaproteobacteria bacterium]